MKKTSLVALCAGIATAALVAGAGAGPADAGPLPGGSVRADLGGGNTMTAKLVNERVSRHGGNVAAVPTSREVWVSGSIRVSITGEATGGVIKGGYVVGCQVNLSGGSGSGNSTTSINPNNTQYPVSVAQVGAGSTLTLGPGQAVYKPIITQTNAAVDTTNVLYNVNGYKFTGNRASLGYNQEPMRVNGCAGYAQARARFTVTVATPTTKADVVLWGRPFSLG